MIEELKKLQNNSYAPYSNFKVAAIVVTKDNKHFNGVNVENANGTSICAERNAISALIASGYKKGDIDSIHILASKDNKINMPCFSCRQVLIEFMNESDKVYCYNQKGDVLEYTIKELCPFPFTEGDLK